MVEEAGGRGERGEGGEEGVDVDAGEGGGGVIGEVVVRYGEGVEFVVVCDGVVVGKVEGAVVARRWGCFDGWFGCG